jgi:hypothetical protein
LKSTITSVITTTMVNQDSSTVQPTPVYTGMEAPDSPLTLGPTTVTIYRTITRTHSGTRQMVKVPLTTITSEPMTPILSSADKGTTLMTDPDITPSPLRGKPSRITLHKTITHTSSGIEQTAKVPSATITRAPPAPESSATPAYPDDQDTALDPAKLSKITIYKTITRTHSGTRETLRLPSTVITTRLQMPTYSDTRQDQPDQKDGGPACFTSTLTVTITSVITNQVATVTETVLGSK